MTINTHYDCNWPQHRPFPDPRYSKCSPNLVVVRREMMRRWGMTDLGCYGVRMNRDGTAVSSHSFGAAQDIRYAESIGRARALQEVIPWLISMSAELHIETIHDYVGCRIWHAGRSGGVENAFTSWWLTQPKSTTSGMGMAWAGYFHLETTQAGWADDTPLGMRGLTDVPPTPIPNPQTGGFVHATIRKGDTNADVFACQVILRKCASQTFVVADGQFGSITEQAVINVQRFCGLAADGIVGPQTWATLDMLANT